jgi:outer membrane protein OmpA-like peptidoglycan-associated protein
MMRVRYLFALVLLVLTGCSAPAVFHQEECPPPPMPACKPGSFSETLIDTNYPGPGKIYQQIRVLPPNINTDANDHALAVIKRDDQSFGLVTSNRIAPETGSPMASEQQLYLTDLSFSKYPSASAVDRGSAPSPFGSAYFCEADGQLYFSAKGDNRDPNDYDLYVAKPSWARGVLSLQNVRALTSLNEAAYFESQPSLTKDGKTIYFASDRKGGQGGVDIWSSTRISGDEWSKPQPLGTTINTLCDEITPFINSNGTLIFASNGHSTVGGYDLFQSPALGSGFDIPRNLGKPVNTKYDEYYPFAATDSTFYYASSQPAPYLGVNLFVLLSSRIGLRAVAERPRIAKEDSLREALIAADRERLYNEPATVHGQITRGADKTPAQGAEIFVRDNATQQEIERKELGPKGEFNIKLEKGKVYDIGAETGETFYAIKTLDLRRSLDTNIVLELNLPDTLVLRINFPFDDYSHPYEFMIGDNGEQLPMSWQNSLDLVARSAKSSLSTLKEIVVIGHTDSMGTDEYNNKLGERRAAFIRDELVKRGIPRGVMRIVSRGRMQPIARRPDESDEIYRLRSRRAEFIKVFK